jgi:hypothetical protein
MQFEYASLHSHYSFSPSSICDCRNSAMSRAFPLTTPSFCPLAVHRKVDLYLNGHEHYLDKYSALGVPGVTTGAGSLTLDASTCTISSNATANSSTNCVSGPLVLPFYQPGFTLHEFSADFRQLTTSFVDTHGNKFSPFTVTKNAQPSGTPTPPPTPVAPTPAPAGPTPPPTPAGTTPCCYLGDTACPVGSVCCRGKRGKAKCKAGRACSLYYANCTGTEGKEMHCHWDETANPYACISGDGPSPPTPAPATPTPAPAVPTPPPPTPPPPTPPPPTPPPPTPDSTPCCHLGDPR